MHCTDLSFTLVFFAQCTIAQTFTLLWYTLHILPLQRPTLCTLHKPTHSTAQCFPFHKTQHFSIVVQWKCEKGGLCTVWFCNAVGFSSMHSSAFQIRALHYICVPCIEYQSIAIPFKVQYNTAERDAFHCFTIQGLALHYISKQFN